MNNETHDDIHASLQLVLEEVSRALAPTGADLTVVDSIRYYSVNTSYRIVFERHPLSPESKASF